MRKPSVPVLVPICVLVMMLCATIVSTGAENILDTDATGTDLVMADLALRDTVSYTGDPSDWRIYFHPGVRFGTDDRVIGFYDLMVPIYLSDNSILFINPRFSHDSMDGHEWNLGGGYRHILWNDQLLLGVNAYYDIKKHGDSGKYFDQWGMGFEVMGEFDEILKSGGGLGLTGRFNFYVPLEGARSGGDEKYTFRTLGIYSDGGTVYEPLAGLDYEAGFRIPYLSNYVETWVYAGGYHYQGRESGHLDGFCGRIEVIPADFLALDFEYRNDNRQGDEFYGEVKVEVPFSIGNLVRGENPFEGLGSRFGGSRDLAERMVEPVRRDIDIKIETIEPGIGEITGGMVEEIIFVSEGGEVDTLADGSFEHPYGSITDAMADPRIGVTAFTIHVINDNGGDGVAGGGDITGSGVAGFMIWGSGAAHPVYAAPTNMTSGYPEISSTIGVDDDAMEILGLHFNTGGAGLVASGGTGMSIHHNLFSIYGIDIDGFADASIHDNTFDGTTTGGVLIRKGSGLDIYGNRFLGGYGVFANDPGGAASDVHITGNTFDVSNYAMWFNYATGIEGLVIRNNDIAVDPSGGNSIFLQFLAPGSHIGTAGSPVIINGNRITGSSGIGLYSAGDMFAEITDNTVSIGGSGGSGITGINVTSTDGNCGFDGTTITPVLVKRNIITINAVNGGATGINLEANAALFAEITDNDLTGGITARFNAEGIRMNSGSIGTDGTTVAPVLVENNFMAVTSDNSTAVGLACTANGPILSRITNNNMSGGITGNWYAYGILLVSNSSLIGDSSLPTPAPTLVRNNTGAITGGAYRYQLWLDTGTPGGGNYVDWTGNSFTPAGGDGTWDGNYDTGEALPQLPLDENQPVNTNFGVGDVITP